MTVKLDSNVAFNHACGCTKCWKPDGALFSHRRRRRPRQAERHRQRQQAEDRGFVRRDPALRLHAAAACTCTDASRTRRIRFYGFDFVHVELSKDKGWAAPEFAAFVSSIIESGAKPEQMGAVRARLKELGLEPYDCLSPPLMDLIATHTAKTKGTLRT